MNAAVLQSDFALDDALTRLIDEEKPGIALCAPATVPAGARSLRIAGCRVETLREAARRPSFESIAAIVAAQLETGRVRAARAFTHSMNVRTAGPVPDPGLGYTGSVFRVDVAERLGIPLVPGPIAVWMVARERAAGPERIVVESPPRQGIDDPEVAKFIATWQRRTQAKPRGADPQTVWPAETVFGKYPTYRKSPETPPMPDNGIVIRANQQILSGSFRLKIPRRHVVTEPLSGDPTTALVPVTLVIIDNEIPGHPSTSSYTRLFRDPLDGCLPRRRRTIQPESPFLHRRVATFSHLLHLRRLATRFQTPGLRRSFRFFLRDINSEKLRQVCRLQHSRTWRPAGARACIRDELFLVDISEEK